jgi:hypothetical protein
LDRIVGLKDFFVKKLDRIAGLKGFFIKSYKSCNPVQKYTIYGIKILSKN